VWVVGSEGTGALGMMQEVALTVILDLIAKVCQTNPPHVMPMCVSAS
jgi:bacteriorhodopsin